MNELSSQDQFAKLSYAGHVLMEYRNGLIVTTRVTKMTGTAKCEAGLEMIEEISGARRITAGGVQGYDQKKFVGALRRENVTRMWRGTRGGRAAVPATNGRRDIRDTRSASGCANGWKRFSAG